MKSSENDEIFVTNEKEQQMELTAPPSVDPKDLLGNRAWAPALYAEGWLTGVKG